MKGLGLKWVSLTAGLVMVLNIHAQHEIGVFGGGSFYLGDLNPYTPYKCTHAAGGVFFRQHLNRRLNLRYAVTYGLVSASDAQSGNEQMENRNLSFKSPLYEFGGLLDINFRKFEAGDKNKYYSTAYLFVGLALTRIKPQAYMNDRWFELQPLGTEGQGSELNNKKKYAVNQLVVPLGVGFKGNLTPWIVIGFEFGIRKMFTDFLDDVSGDYQDPVALAQLNGPLAAALADRSYTFDSYNAPGSNRGNSLTKDWYSFSGMTLSLVIGRPGECKNNFKKKRELW
ncbi:MAG: DUF6089 family protein [Flavobacteriales bacterium]